MATKEESAKDLQSTSEQSTEKMIAKDEADDDDASTEITEITEISTSAEASALDEISTSVIVSAPAEVSRENPSSSNEYIRLRVITGEMTNEIHFRVKPATALGRLKHSYCNKLGLVADELRFIFDGTRISDDDTPNSLGMVDDDVIEIYQERIGGKYILFK